MLDRLREYAERLRAFTTDHKTAANQDKSYTDTKNAG
jgi:hypothetical protein